MTRDEIIARFREEVPEATSRVVTDAVLQNWLTLADKEFCAETRCILDQDGTTISTTEDDTNYNLASEITNFYDIDDSYASGVLYNGQALTKTTMAALDMDSKSWRDRSSGTPKKYYRRGTYLYLDRPVGSEEYDLKVYSVLISNDWTTDVAPYNSLEYLTPFHEAMLLNIIARAKAKIAKPQEAQGALQQYLAFVKWAKVQLLGNKSCAIYFRKRV